MLKLVLGVDNAFDVTRFETAAARQLDRNNRTFASAFTHYRSDAIYNVDLSMLKNMTLVERWVLQFRAESFAAFDHTIFNPPNVSPTDRNFARITSAANLPRTLQLALRLTF